MLDIIWTNLKLRENKVLWIKDDSLFLHNILFLQVFSFSLEYYVPLQDLSK